MASSSERRRFPRVDSEFPLRFRQIPVSGAGYLQANVEDVSASGVRFWCSEEVRVRSSLLFELLIPGAEPVHSFGRAVWVRERPNREGFEIGGRFEEQSTMSRKALERHLQRENAPAGA